MINARKNYKKKRSKRSIKPDKMVKSAIVTVRISDEEKERIEELMKKSGIKRYSDIMRMALQMTKRRQLLVS